MTDMTEVLSVTSKKQLQAVSQVLQIDIDGDWDEVMIGGAFDGLERILDRLESGESTEGDEETGTRRRPRRGGAARSRGRRGTQR